MRQFTIALGVERDNIGFDHYRLPEGWKRPKSVRVIKYDSCKGWAILMCPRGTFFSLANPIILCPAAEAPVMSTDPKFHMYHCKVTPFLYWNTMVLGVTVEEAMNLISIACFDNIVTFQGSSGGVVVDSKNRGVAILFEAREHSPSIVNCITISLIATIKETLNA
jgi:hypothetical protein